MFECKLLSFLIRRLPPYLRRSLSILFWLSISSEVGGLDNTLLSQLSASFCDDVAHLSAHHLHGTWQPFFDLKYLLHYVPYYSYAFQCKNEKHSDNAKKLITLIEDARHDTAYQG